MRICGSVPFVGCECMFCVVYDGHVFNLCADVYSSSVVPILFIPVVSLALKSPTISAYGMLVEVGYIVSWYSR